MQGSEVMQLRQRIADEYQAAINGLSGPASSTTRHQFITQKMENMRQCQAELEAIVGQQAAVQIVAETLVGGREQ